MAELEELRQQLQDAKKEAEDAKKAADDAKQEAENAKKEAEDAKRNADEGQRFKTRAEELDSEVNTLNDTVNGLKTRERELREELEVLSKKVPSASAGVGEVKPSALQLQPRTVLITRERKLQKLCGRPKTDSDPDVSDWVSDIRQHIIDLDESQKIDTILGFLGGEAKTEVKLYPKEERSTAEDILNIISTLYKDVDNLATLHKDFYDRLQKKDETLQSYSLALMKLREKIHKKSPNAVDDTALRTRFIEGVMDQGLKRDLRKLARDHEKATFVEFRRLVLDWIGDEESKATVKTSVKTSEQQASVTADKQGHVTLEDLTKMHLQLAKTVENVMKELKTFTPSQQKSPAAGDKPAAKGDPATDPADTPRKPPKCWKCGKLGHIAKYHRDDYVSKSNKKSENKDTSETTKVEN